MKGTMAIMALVGLAAGGKLFIYGCGGKEVRRAGGNEDRLGRGRRYFVVSIVIVDQLVFNHHTLSPAQRHTRTTHLMASLQKVRQQ
jgi:hypothetical protein